MTEQELLLLAQARRRRAEAEATLPGNDSEEETAEPERPTLGGTALAALDIGQSMLTNTAGQILGGVAGVAGGLTALGDRNRVAERSEAWRKFVADAVGTELHSDAGRAVRDEVFGSPKVQKAAAWLEDKAERARAANLEYADNNPELATLRETALLGLPEVIMGGKSRIAHANLPKIPSKSARLKEMEASAQRLGIDLNNDTIHESTRAAAATLAQGAPPMDGQPLGGRAVTGAGDLHPAMKGAEEASRTAVNSMFSEARATDARLQLDPILRTTRKIEKDLTDAGADLGEETIIGQRLRELEQVRERVIGARKGNDARSIPGESTKILGPDGKPLRAAEDIPVEIPLNEMEIMVGRLTTDIANAVGRGDHGAARHLRTFRRELNDMLDEQFDKDMISGDPTAKKKWTDAKLAWRRHKERFSDDRTIERIVRNDYTAKDTIKLIFGASEIGHRSEAYRTVRKIKDILGPDALELDSLRQAFYADMFDPIFKDEPSWGTALERIRRIKRDDAALIRELGISEADIDFMERAVRVGKGVVTKTTLEKKGLLAMGLARWFFGHDIARAGFITKMAHLVLSKALGVGQKTHEQLLKEFAAMQEQASTPLFRGLKEDTRTHLLNAHAAALAATEDEEE